MDGILPTQENVPQKDRQRMQEKLRAAIQALESSDAGERVRAREAVQAYSEQMERMVEQRTAELRQAQARLSEQRLLQHDLELAQQVQASLLLREVPEMAGYQFAVEARPARYVSGDLYDIVPRGRVARDGVTQDGNACYLVLADIAGKGVPAALLMATTRTLIRAETEHHDSPAVLLSNVNRLLSEDLARTESFVTALAAHLDTRLGRLTYASAGHTEALWWRDARRACQRLPAPACRWPPVYRRASTARAT